jgi:ethanolamine permease
VGGFIVGVTDTIEYVLTPAVIVVGIGGYMDALISGVPVYVWWGLAYALFVGINIYGVELTLKVGLVITLLAVAVLVVFYVGAIVSGAFDWDLLSNVPPAEGNSKYLPEGWYGVFAALPFAIWFYLAIEQLPLAAEETNDIVRDMPKALILGIFTLLVLSLFTLVLNAGVDGGALVIGASPAPLADGFKAVFGGGATTTVLTLIALTGLIASFHTVMYAYGRVLFALSRAGYYPRWLSITGTTTRTPQYALIAGAVIGFLAALVIDRLGDRFGGQVGASLLNMAVFGAVLSYAAVMFSYIKLRRDRPELVRPYRSPLGAAGAWVGAILALLAVAATFASDAYRPSVYRVAIFLVIALLYFAGYSSKRLVARAPEEEVALVAEAQQELRHT